MSVVRTAVELDAIFHGRPAHGIAVKVERKTAEWHIDGGGSGVISSVEVLIRFDDPARPDGEEYLLATAAYGNDGRLGPWLGADGLTPGFKPLEDGSLAAVLTRIVADEEGRPDAC